MSPDHTLPSAHRDYPEWHHGRPRYAVWALAINDPAVAARLAQVRAALAPWLLHGYQRQPHITLQVCGFPNATPQRPDDYAPPQLQAQAEALAWQAPKPFELQIGGAFSFSSAACLAVYGADKGPPEELLRLRQALNQGAASPDHTPYVPHVTAGLYNAAWPLHEVQSRLAPLAALPAITLTVRALAWMVYDSRVIAGPLRSLRVFDLERRALDAVADEDTFSVGSG